MNETGKIRPTCGVGAAKPHSCPVSAYNAAAGSETGDSIEISATGAYLSKLDATRQTSVEQLTRSVSPARLAQLRADYAGNRCPVSATQIAYAMTENFFGKGEL